MVARDSYSVPLTLLPAKNVSSSDVPLPARELKETTSEKVENSPMRTAKAHKKKERLSSLIPDEYLRTMEHVALTLGDTSSIHLTIVSHVEIEIKVLCDPQCTT